MNIFTVPIAMYCDTYDKCTYCKSLWIKASAKRPKCKCKCKYWDEKSRCSTKTQQQTTFSPKLLYNIKYECDPGVCYQASIFISINWQRRCNAYLAESIQNVGICTRDDCCLPGQACGNTPTHWSNHNGTTDLGMGLAWSPQLPLKTHLENVPAWSRDYLLHWSTSFELLTHISQPKKQDI